MLVEQYIDIFAFTCRFKNSQSMKILILCTGNSCRSQMAQGILREIDSNLEVFSAGTKPANIIHPMAIKVMNEIGIDIANQSPTDIKVFLQEKWDYVITVCGNANGNCPTFIGEVQHRLHIGFDDPAKACGTTEYIENEFRRIRDEIKQKMVEFHSTEIKNNQLSK